jgi:predicted nucleic acid-binding protein
LDIFADTSVVIRFVSPDDPKHELVCAAVAELLFAGHRLIYTPQVARETWSVITRPISNNGLGLTPVTARTQMSYIAEVFTFLDDMPGIFEIWAQLVQDSGVSGKQIHDANHVAAMLAHGIQEILTLDERDFRRYARIRIRKPA